MKIFVALIFLTIFISFKFTFGFESDLSAIEQLKNALERRQEVIFKIDFLKKIF